MCQGQQAVGMSGPSCSYCPGWTHPAPTCLLPCSLPCLLDLQLPLQHLETLLGGGGEESGCGGGGGIAKVTVPHARSARRLMSWVSVQRRTSGSLIATKSYQAKLQPRALHRLPYNSATHVNWALSKPSQQHQPATPHHLALDCLASICEAGVVLHLAAGCPATHLQDRRAQATQCIRFKATQRIIAMPGQQ